MPLTASPSVPWLGAILVGATLLALFCSAPLILVLMSFVGLAPFDFGMLVVSVPVAGIAVLLAVIGRTAALDLLLPRPVLTLGADAIHDRRVSDRPIAWRDVAAATAILEGHGGVVLELREVRPTRLEPFRPGTFLFERPAPGVAHVPVRTMTVPAGQLAEAILAAAARHGATVARARAHPHAPRRGLW